MRRLCKRNPVVWLLAALLCLFSAWARSASADKVIKTVLDRDKPLMGDLLRAPFFGDLPQIMDRTALAVATTYSSVTFFILQNGVAHGFEYRMMKDYGKALDKLRKKRKNDKRRNLPLMVAMVPVPSNLLVLGLNKGYFDVAAAGLTITEERRKKVDFTEPYLTGINEIVVAYKKSPALKKLADLSGKKVYVRKSSSYYRSLQKLNKELEAKGKKPVDIVEADETLSTEDILELVNSGVEPYTVADSHLAALWVQVLPKVRVYEKLKLREGGEIAWMVRKSNPKLKASLNAFIKKHRQGTKIGNIYFNRYFKNTRWIKNPVEKQLKARLKKYIKWFRKYSEIYKVDWMLMAAQGYYESGLDNRKRSRAGAMGIMQLMPSLAKDKRVGIKNLKPAKNNIHAGIKYLAVLRDQYFNGPDINPDNRMRFALAAYNAGPAKVQRIRALAKKSGYNPNVWFGHCEMAALRLVGQETVRYIRNINKYYIALRLVMKQREFRQEFLEHKTANLED